MIRSAKKLTAADLFCGGGGTSEGLARACAKRHRGLDLVAVNHWDLAIETHRRNHPDARHVLGPIEGVNPRELVPSGRLNILVASPECTDHSQAKGGRPKNDQSRASAWLILKWLQELYVEAILIENVPEFQEWGPLGADGRPLKSKRGVLFRQFIEDLRALGYQVDWRVLNAANYGDPTTRQRLFIMGRRGRNRKVTWPEPSHQAIHKTAMLYGDRKPWKAAREIIDWSIPGNSIFTRKRPLALNTLKRILAGMQKFKWPEPFLIVLRNHMAARSLDEPLPALTAGGTHMGLCEPFMLSQQSGGSPRDVGQPMPTVATDGAIALVEPFVLGQQSDGAPRSTEEPMPMIATAGKVALIEPFIMVNRTNNAPKSVDEPVPPLCTGNHMYKVEPFMVPFFGERDGQSPRVHSVDDPLPAVTSHGAGAIIEPFTVPLNRAKDRLRSVDEPMQTITATSSDIGVVEPFIMTASHGEGDRRRCKSLDDPLATITATRDHGIVEPMILKFDHQGNNGGRARSIDSPLPTITTKNGLAVVEPFILPQFGEACAKSVGEPLGTITTTSRGVGLAEPFIAAEPFLTKFYGTGRPADVDDPLDTVTVKERFGLCQIGDVLYDIRFRMLRPRELARAQGFPDSYEFVGGNADITKMVGNAVPVGVAEALCAELLQ